MINNKFIKILIFILILTFYGSLLAHKIELPAADDMARHVKNGELILNGDFSPIYQNLYSYTEADHIFINHNWFSNVVFYLLHQSVGWDGLVIFKIILLLSMFAILFLVSLKKANFWLVAVLSLPAILIIGERTALRPEIFSYIFLATFLYLLIDYEENPGHKRIFWLIPLQLLWVNMHLFFIVGITVVGGFFIEKVIINYKNIHGNKLVKELALLLLVLIAVSFINPHGIDGALYPLNIFNNYGYDVGENNSTASILKLRAPLDNIPIIFFQWSVVVLALSFLFNFSKKSTFYFLAGTAAAVGGFRMVRLISLFGIVSLPIISANLNETVLWIRNRANPRLSKNLERIFIVTFVVLLAYLIFLGSSGKLSNYKKPGIGLTESSNNSAIFFKEQNLKGPIFNNFGMGSYLIYHLYPQEMVFVDNRAEAYSNTFFTDSYLPAIQDEDGWQKVLQQYQFNLLFLYQYGGDYGLHEFMYRRMHDPVWSLVYADTYAVILIRNSVENAGIINQFKITPENVDKRLESLLKSPDYDSRIVFADILGLLGREDLQGSAYLKIVETWPEKGKVWTVLGDFEYRKNPSLAVTYLEKAIEAGYKTPEAYYLLSLAYKNLGEGKKSEEALKKALKIDPNYLDPR